MANQDTSADPVGIVLLRKQKSIGMLLQSMSRGLRDMWDSVAARWIALENPTKMREEPPGVRNEKKQRKVDIF